MRRLSDLILQRDRCLLELDTLASLPLSISPRSGHVAEFELEAACELLDAIEKQTAQIQQGMDAVNEIARQMQRTPLVWLKMPRRNSADDQR